MRSTALVRAYPQFRKYHLIGPAAFRAFMVRYHNQLIMFWRTAASLGRIFPQIGSQDGLQHSIAHYLLRMDDTAVPNAGKIGNNRLNLVAKSQNEP